MASQPIKVKTEEPDDESAGAEPCTLNLPCSSTAGPLVKDEAIESDARLVKDEANTSDDGSAGGVGESDTDLPHSAWSPCSPKAETVDDAHEGAACSSAAGPPGIYAADPPHSVLWIDIVAGVHTWNDPILLENLLGRV